MLDRAKVVKKLRLSLDKLFIDTRDEYELARATWQLIADDSTFLYKVKEVTCPWAVPSWQAQRIDQAIPVTPLTTDYTVGSIDGSQIYPDRHQGTSCYLINIGEVLFTYGAASSSVQYRSDPYIFSADDGDELINGSLDIVNCLRQEYEFHHGVAQALSYQQSGGNQPYLLLFDGSLIFWHLESKDIVLKERFLPPYLQALHTLYQNRMPIAGYISLPKSKELVNLIRIALCDFKVEECQAYKGVDHIVDATVASFFLTPSTRSIVFKNHSPITKQYHDVVHPHFFYINVGAEIGRVEIPAWIAHDDATVSLVASLILDQAHKGRGYPIAIAEAHEQAVVKGPDRDFFYQMIVKLGIENHKQTLFSAKSMKKKSIGI